jgi:hypothetical protein
MVTYRRYHQAMEEHSFDVEKFTAQAIEGCRLARLETLAAGVPVLPDRMAPARAPSGRILCEII